MTTDTTGDLALHQEERRRQYSTATTAHHRRSTIQYIHTSTFSHFTLYSPCLVEESTPLLNTWRSHFPKTSVNSCVAGHRSSTLALQLAMQASAFPDPCPCHYQPYSPLPRHELGRGSVHMVARPRCSTPRDRSVKGLERCLFGESEGVHAVAGKLPRIKIW